MLSEEQLQKIERESGSPFCLCHLDIRALCAKVRHLQAELAQERARREALEREVAEQQEEIERLERTLSYI